MTAREHLIIHLQHLYSFTGDILPLLDRMHHATADAALDELILSLRARMRAELEPLERSLNLLGGRYAMAHDPLAAAIRESDARFIHRLNPSAEQRDLHGALVLTGIQSLLIGEFDNAIALAQAIGEADVRTLLEEILTRHRESLAALKKRRDALLDTIKHMESRLAA